ncbi:MAG TPA: hypothetical protein VKA89_04625 [Solirubrobacterales bacterium]|nr:hypothetical protein [Solirubrobacterales bacterium]
MGSFKRALLGYRRSEVHAALLERDALIAGLDGEMRTLSEMVIGGEREIRVLTERLREMDERHARALETLDSVTQRLDELHAQARGQATRIRMKALSEAVEMSRRVQERSARLEADPATVLASPNGNGHPQIAPAELFDGLVRVDIGPLGDFSQLVGFEDAAGQIDATSEISVERFSEGRATLAVKLDKPVDLVGELEARSPLGFSVRRNGADAIVLDVEHAEAPQRRAA